MVRMVYITKTPGYNNGCRYNPELLSGIYMNLVKEAQCHIVAKNWIKQYEAKQILVRVNSFKKSYQITKQDRYFENILSTASKIGSDTNTTEEYTDYELQGILALSYDTLRDTFFHLGLSISDLPNIKKCTVVVDIANRWGKYITEEAEMTISKV